MHKVAGTGNGGHSNLTEPRVAMDSETVFSVGLAKGLGYRVPPVLSLSFSLPLSFVQSESVL